MARREERAYREYVSDEQRSQPGCPARELCDESLLRDTRSGMNSDIRVGLRLLRKEKAFTITAALTLALCIGANTALFSVVHNVLLRPLPVPESDRIVLMGNAYPGAGAGAAAGGNSGVPDYYDRLRETDVYEEQALFNGANQSVVQNGIPV